MCEREGERQQRGRLKLTVFGGVGGNVQSGVKIMSLKYQSGIDCRVN